MAAWAVVCLVGLRPAYEEKLGPNFIANERMYYVKITGVAHPISTDDFLGHPVAPSGAATVAAAPPGTLVLRGASDDWWLYREAPGTPSTIVWLNLGVTGELSPLEVRVHDSIGLTNPLAAHATSIPNGRIGHDKELPIAWDVADAGVTDAPGLRPGADRRGPRGAGVPPHPRDDRLGARAAHRRAVLGQPHRGVGADLLPLPLRPGRGGGLPDRVGPTRPCPPRGARRTSRAPRRS